MAMDLTNNTNATVLTPDTDTDASPPPSSSAKHLSFTNGQLKRHHHHLHLQRPVAVAAAAVSYKECLKNHAAILGGHALDGCGEFMPSSSPSADPTSLGCAACGCHRNFHRRDSSDEPTPFHQHFALDLHHRPPPRSKTTTTHPPPLHPRRISDSPSSPLPPPSTSPQPLPPPSSFYSPAPHMLLALRTACGHHHQPSDEGTTTPSATTRTESLGGGVRRRSRTKFTQHQKDRMWRFAERLGWKMPNRCGGGRDEGLVRDFCNEIGVSRGVLKVWMHNNKHTFAKHIKEFGTTSHNNGNNVIVDSRVGGFEVNINIDDEHRHGIDEDDTNHNHHDLETDNSLHLHVSTNGSSSSS